MRAVAVVGVLSLALGSSIAGEPAKYQWIVAGTMAHGIPAEGGGGGRTCNTRDGKVWRVEHLAPFVKYHRNIWYEIRGFRHETRRSGGYYVLRAFGGLVLLPEAWSLPQCPCGVACAGTRGGRATGASSGTRKSGYGPKPKVPRGTQPPPTASPTASGAASEPGALSFSSPQRPKTSRAPSPSVQSRRQRSGPKARGRPREVWPGLRATPPLPP